MRPNRPTFLILCFLAGMGSLSFSYLGWPAMILTVAERARALIIGFRW
jgi:hypothetical protein